MTTAKKRTTLDLTNGRTLPLMLRFCLPILLGNLMQQFYNMADAAIVGKFLGTNALAAVGATGAVIFLVIGLWTVCAQDSAFRRRSPSVQATKSCSASAS